jgi:NADH:ubiquinone oxidoreductase subunit 3 (subunit A)
VSTSPKGWSSFLKVVLVITIIAFLYGLLNVSLAVSQYLKTQAYAREKMQQYEDDAEAYHESEQPGSKLERLQRLEEIARTQMQGDLGRHALTYMMDFLQVHRYLVIPAVLGAVLWMVWQYLFMRNLAAAEPGEGQYRPDAVFWWLVPLANLVVPYRVMRQLLADSGANYHYSPGVLRLWSLAVVLAPVLVGAYFVLEKRLDIWVRQWVYIALGVGDILVVFAAWAGIVLVTRAHK